MPPRTIKQRGKQCRQLKANKQANNAVSDEQTKAGNAIQTNMTRKNNKSSHSKQAKNTIGTIR